jgi:PqqD family protein of HPr-rel-A system
LSVSALRWHTVPRSDLIWRELDGDLVVRDARSGSTHLLEPLAGHVLRALSEAHAGMSIPDLVARLQDEAGADETSAWFSAIEAILSEFRRLGLAEPERP